MGGTAHLGALLCYQGVVTQKWAVGVAVPQNGQFRDDSVVVAIAATMKVG